MVVRLGIGELAHEDVKTAEPRRTAFEQRVLLMLVVGEEVLQRRVLEERDLVLRRDNRKAVAVRRFLDIEVFARVEKRGGVEVCTDGADARASEARHERPEIGFHLLGQRDDCWFDVPHEQIAVGLRRCVILNEEVHDFVFRESERDGRSADGRLGGDGVSGSFVLRGERSGIRNVQLFADPAFFVQVGIGCDELRQNEIAAQHVERLKRPRLGKETRGIRNRLCNGGHCLSSARIPQRFR